MPALYTQGRSVKQPHVLLERWKAHRICKPGVGIALGAYLLGHRKRYAVMAQARVENLTVSYNRHPAVHHVSGVFASGSLTAVTGPNGGGKSTLMKSIAGLLQPDEGSVHVECSATETVAYLPQAAELQRDFPMSVLHLVCSGTWHKTGAWGRITPAMKTRAQQALVDVGLEGFGRRDLASLSSGQFQRALFARLIVQDASLILLDEPFTAVDSDTTSHLLDIILRWHHEKRTVICILHDLEHIRRHFPYCVLMARECLAWGKTDDVLSDATLSHARFFKDRQNAFGSASGEICKQAS